MQNNETDVILSTSPLGKKSTYVNTYTPSLLFPLPRKQKREEIGIFEELPFTGFDFWTGFEISWLNLKGKPMVAIGEFRIPANSKYLIESKSFKLYLNSFNSSKFESFYEVKEIMKKDLSNALDALAGVCLFPINNYPKKITEPKGLCLDELDIECTQYLPEISNLKIEKDLVKESFHTNLLKSNCLVTGQPDWGTVEISYEGEKISHSGFLKYIVSLRDHNEFHEQCAERIFMDIIKNCKPKILSVYARYTRRGGLDINPFRTNMNIDFESIQDRFVRQ